MTCWEKQKVEDIVVRIRVILAAPEFGTSEQQAQLEDISDELTLLSRKHPAADN